MGISFTSLMAKEIFTPFSGNTNIFALSWRERGISSLNHFFFSFFYTQFPFFDLLRMWQGEAARIFSLSFSSLRQYTALGRRVRETGWARTRVSHWSCLLPNFSHLMEFRSTRLRCGQYSKRRRTRTTTKSFFLCHWFWNQQGDSLEALTWVSQGFWLLMPQSLMHFTRDQQSLVQ